MDWGSVKCTYPLQLISNLSNIPQLDGFDIERNVLTHVNFNYCSIPNFKSSIGTEQQSFESDYFSVIHSNIRSLSANYDKLITLLSDLNHKFTLVGLTETKIMKERSITSNISMNGYQFLSQPTNSNAGGVGFYVRDDLEFHCRDDFTISTNDFECLSLEIHCQSHSNIICSVIYRHPNSNFDNFDNYLTIIMNKISNENKYCIFMGDFNINLLNYDSHTPTEQFISNLTSYCFQPHILQPTRITDHTATLIDNIFFNSLDFNCISGNLISDISDHLPNFLIFNKLNIKSKKQKIYRRDYSKFNKDQFLEEVRSVNWDEALPDTNNINEIFDSFYNKISACIDKYAPLQKLSKKQRSFLIKPWITKGLQVCIAKKNKLYKLYIRNRNAYYWSKYKLHRNKLKHLLDISKKLYYNEYFKNNVGNMRDMWKGIKQIITVKQSSLHIPSTIDKDNTSLKDSKLIANAFNNYFSNVGSNISNEIPNVSTSFLHYLDRPVPQGFQLYPTSTLEIESIIGAFNGSKSTGPFSIPTKLLKMLQSILSAPLAHIFNCSFSTGVVPDKLKIARIIPIFKKGSKTQVSNYRPISLLSIFNKILEKLMYNRLINFLEKKQLIFHGQYGFRSNHSTSHALLLITDKIQKAIEDGMFGCGIFLDLKKAFDTVDHEILLKKLEFYGIRGLPLQWFSSYLKNRKQFVSIGNVVSDQKPISCGVPQGSVLGPLLFLLYINDFSNSTTGLDFHLFADDSNLFYSHKNLVILERHINEQLIKIHEWLCANKLALNISKSNFVLFHPVQKKPNYILNLKICNQQITQKQSINYLGIIIDSHLMWKNHVHELTKKISRGIGVLLKLRKFVSTQVLLQLYYAIIYSFLTYSVLAWGNTYITNLKPLIILQKKAVRIITFSDYRKHTSSLFKALKLLKFSDIVKFYTGTFMLQYSKGQLPVDFDNLFTEVKNIHGYKTRLASEKITYALTLPRTNYGIFNIRFYGPKVWNPLDESLKSMNIQNFKKKLKNYFINHYE